MPSYQQNKLKLAGVVLAVGTAVGLAQCRNPEVKTTLALPVVTPSQYAPPEAKALTELGENYRPRLSADGRHLLFISRNRTRHSQPQAYELNLDNKKERRITYQDGIISDVTYVDEDQRIAYSSSTDEIKENPEFIRHMIDAAKTSQPYEFISLSGETLGRTDIYSSLLTGNDIQRLTAVPGFDGQIVARPKTHDLIFVSTREGRPQIYRMNVHSGEGVTLVSENHDPCEFPQFSPDGKLLAWVKKVSDKPTSEIWYEPYSTKKSSKVIGNNAVYLTPSWSPDGQSLIFSANLDDEKNFEIYVVNLDGSCLRRLTYNQHQEFDPLFTPDGKSVIFVSDRSGQKQIYLMDYSPPPCIIQSQ